LPWATHAPQTLQDVTAAVLFVDHRPLVALINVWTAAKQATVAAAYSTVEMAFIATIPLVLQEKQ